MWVSDEHQFLELRDRSGSARPNAMSDEPVDGKPSPVEGFKVQSNYLRGTISQELVDGNDHFSKGSVQLLKNHGTYQQDDRDSRSKVAGKKSERAISFMVRTRVPGGKLTSDQLLAELDLCDELGNTTLRVTTRQALQLHGIAKGDLKAVIKKINDVQLSTLAACGDVERNIMCCPAPHRFDPVHDQLQETTDRLAQHLAPRTGAYHEIWLTDPTTGEQQLVAGGAPSSNGDEVEPIYGKTYLPRKFKTAIGLPGDNCADVYANDLGFLAICQESRIVGYNVLAGGGFGVTPSAAKTWPAVAKKVGFCTPDEILDVATAIIKVQRDHGNRSDRKVARLKYTMARLGLDVFRSKVEEYLGRPLAPATADDVFGFDDHLGCHPQGDGKFYYGLNIENGRIKDEGDFRMKTALREICARYRPSLRLTSHQSILFIDLAEGDIPGLEEILKRNGVKLLPEISAVRRWSMACPAWPTCGLAITESERALPGIIDRFEVELARLGLGSEVFTTRMTGCPNGCARPYNSDIGLVGKAAGKYTVLLGGRLLGDRLNFIYKDLVPEEEVVSTLVPVFTYFKQARNGNETFGEFCERMGVETLRNWCEAYVAQGAR